MNKKSRNRAKRAVRIRLTLVYTLMVVSVALLVGVLYLFIQGYRFNRYEGQLEQGGLVQFNSSPSDASIWLDNSELGIHTQGRLTISAGTHTITMRKDGYYDWSKKVTVEPGTVVWLHYIRLIPKQLTVTTPVSLGGASSSATSYDDRKVAVVEHAAQPVLRIITADSDTPQTASITLPAASFTAPAAGEAQSFEVSTWAHDNRYVLIKHVYGDKTEWLSLDTANSSTVKNITQSLGVTAGVVRYAKDDANMVFLLDNNADIRRANLDQKTISGPIVQNVESFDLYDSSTVTYVTKPASADNKRTVAYLTLGAKKPRVVAQYDTATANDVKFAVGSFNGNRYLAIAANETVKILTGDLSVSDANNPAAFNTYANFTVAGGVQYLGFSPDEQRFVYAQNATIIASYDLDGEMLANHSFTSQQPAQIHWVDNYHFTTTENSSLTMYDYDGTNGHVLLSRAMTNAALLLQNGHYMYGLQSAENGTSALLARIKLTVD